MIPKTQNPLDKVKQWQKAFDKNREQRNEDFSKAYRRTLCKCGYDKVRCEIKEVKCDKL